MAGSRWEGGWELAAALFFVVDAVLVVLGVVHEIEGHHQSLNTILIVGLALLWAGTLLWGIRRGHGDDHGGGGGQHHYHAPVTQNYYGVPEQRVSKPVRSERSAPERSGDA